MKRQVNQVPRERNQFVAAALFRKAGVHRKSNKAQRKLDKQTRSNYGTEWSQSN
jgi:hypothetical protein